MSIDKFNQHYSMQNIPTVYDEEALTALELCGRLGHKLNEVITAVNGWNPPHIVSVSPTGDTTGELDRAVIQGKLDKGYAVQLSAGDYYLNGPLVFRPGYALKGDSQTNTIINCKAGFIDHENIVSVDHITVRDVTVRGPGYGVGIDISRKASGVETGGRYANFSHVSIAEYDVCVRMGGCWCTHFVHCRFDCLETCVEQRGGCNNVKYDHCMFLGPIDQKTTIGLNITAADGAENYGIYLSHCDFERHATAIKAYCCVALNVTAIYAEGCTDIFNLDSCPAFLCDGGYISFPALVLRGGRSNALPLYEKSGGTIRDIFVRVNAAENWAFMSTPDTCPIKTEKITVRNDGAGTCYANAQLYSSIYNGVTDMEEYHIHFYESYASGLTKTIANPRQETKDLKFISITFMPTAEFTLTEPKTITIDAGDSKALLEITIPAGTHAGWVPFTSHVSATNVGTDYSKLVKKKKSCGYISCRVPAIPVGGHLNFRLAYGEMVL